MTSHEASFLQVATPIASLLLTGAIAFVTLRIQHQQAKTNRNQLRLHLFDRRWKVYEAATSFVAAVAIGRKLTDEELYEIAAEIRGARFLFNQEIQDYCNKLRKEAVAVQISEWTIDEMEAQKIPHTPPQHQQSVEDLGKRLEWFTEQTAEIDRRFAPFLEIVG